ncbi:MAG: A/G-specific adenine glycosylase [Myxococcota bacterium]
MSWAPKPIRRALLRWYDVHARSLPWRETRDPYAIWVSEIMCQQTRVATVVPYYQKFLARFPTPAALAGATEDEVLAMWSGLGYYRRARLLHRGMKEVVDKHGGEVPASYEDRLALPGIGRYTAGAIGSIAFAAEEPVVDGNVSRVLSRIRRIETPLGRSDTEKALWAAAGELVVGPRPGDLNQSIMELGALVCTPRSPSCGDCPVRTHCAGRDIAATLPVPRKKTKVRKVAMVAVVPTRSRPDRVWLTRGAKALFGGLWSVPMVEGNNVKSARDALAQQEIRGRLRTESCGELTHVLSHRELHVRVFRATSTLATPRADLALVERGELTKDRGVSKLTLRILDLAFG